MPRILLVGGGRGLQTELHRLHPDATTVALLRASGLSLVPQIGAHEFAGVLPDGAPPSAWVGAARAIHAVLPFDRVTALAEIDQDKAAAIAADLGFDYHAPDLVAVVNDKHRMREVLAEAGLTKIASARPRTAADALAAADRLGFPLVVKPSGGRGSAGVTIVRHRAEVEAAFEYAVDLGADVGERGACLAVTPPMLEGFAAGPEFSVETFTIDEQHHIAAITEKFVDPDTRVEIGHVVPARLSEADHRKISDYVDAVLTALRVTFGVGHTEVILTPSGPEIVETHLRKAGDGIIELVDDATGWNLDEATVLQSGGSVVEPPPWREEDARAGRHYRQAAAVWFAASDQAGTLLSVSGLDEIEEAESVRAAKSLVKAGDAVESLRSSLSRIASVRVVGEDAHAAIAAAREHVESLRIDIEREAQ